MPLQFCACRSDGCADPGGCSIDHTQFLRINTQCDTDIRLLRNLYILSLCFKQFVCEGCCVSARSCFTDSRFLDHFICSVHSLCDFFTALCAGHFRGDFAVVVRPCINRCSVCMACRFNCHILLLRFKQFIGKDCCISACAFFFTACFFDHFICSIHCFRDFFTAFCAGYFCGNFAVVIRPFIGRCAECMFMSCFIDRDSALSRKATVFCCDCNHS